MNGLWMVYGWSESCHRLDLRNFQQKNSNSIVQIDGYGRKVEITISAAKQHRVFAGLVK